MTAANLVKSSRNSSFFSSGIQCPDPTIFFMAKLRRRIGESCSATSARVTASSSDTMTRVGVMMNFLSSGICVSSSLLTPRMVALYLKFPSLIREISYSRSRTYQLSGPVYPPLAKISLWWAASDSENHSGSGFMVSASTQALAAPRGPRLVFHSSGVWG